MMRIGIGTRIALPLIHRGVSCLSPLNTKINQLAACKLPEFVKKTTDFLASKNLTWEVLNYAFFGIRIPFLYIEYFITKMRSDSIPSIIGSVLSFFSDLGSLFKFLSKIKLIDLGKVSEIFGKVRCFAFLLKIPLVTVVNVLFGLANVFYTIDAVIKLSKGTLEGKEKLAAWLDLAAAVMQVALFVLFLAGCAGMTFFTVLSLITVVVAIGAFCMRMYVGCSQPKPALGM